MNGADGRSFGDVHYFYGPRNANPPHHRFDKGSYVYLFENAGERRARIEVANQPGTDDQDAFDGFLDRTKVAYSYKQQCTVTIYAPETVEGHDEWHLPTFDPRNENKYHYKLVSLDIYFWTPKDALKFVDNIRRILPPSQVDIQDEPAPPPRPVDAGPDPLVSKLERIALSDGQKPASLNGVPSFAPPPISAVNDPTSAGTNNTNATNSTTSSYAPIAPYNPAAPPAPEAVRHREKTPPPEDGHPNPLAAVVAYDQAQPFSPGYAPSIASIASPGLPPSYTHPQGAPMFSPPPRQPLAGMASPGLNAPAGFGMLQRAHTMPPTPGLASPYSPGFPGSPGFHVPQATAAGPTPPVSVSSPAPSGLAAPPPPPPPATVPPAPAAQPVPPPGGFSTYNYAASQAPPQSPPPATAGASSMPLGDYSIHSQVYRPTAAEAVGYKQYEPKGGSFGKEPKGKFEENANRLERGLTGALKRFEKKFG